MKYYSLSLVIINLIFIGCTNSISTPAINNGNKEYRYVNTALNYSIDVPNEAAKKVPSPDSLILGFINYDYTTNHIPSNGYYLSIEGIKNITSNLLPCSPEQVGIYPTSAIKSDSGDIISIRGKADYAEVMKGDYDHTHEPTCKGGYAFCSEHAGKQVTICISQQTDNPKLANEIFDSFKWTK